LPAGAILVDKPAGMTSRRVVDRVGGLLGTRGAGHAGTLDPFAQGVLLVAWGRATRLIPFLHDYAKSYEALVRFGRITDTQDLTGRVLEERDPSSLTLDRIEAALDAFRGVILQTPPMHSAVKVKGRRLYKAARAGETVARAPRERTVHRLDVLGWEPPCLRLEVVCSTGTYVRTLAHDLGAALGPGASLDELVRSAIGPHRLLSASRLDALEDREDVLARALRPDEVLPDWPAVRLESESARRVAHGGVEDLTGRTPEAVGYRVLDAEGRLLAVAMGGDAPRLLRVFAGEEAA
jgi:tRNA pseudouridine55 synthase